MIAFFVGLGLGAVLGAVLLAAYAIYLLDVTTTSVAEARSRGEW